MNNAVVGYYKFMQRRLQVMKEAKAPEGLAEVLNYIDARIVRAGSCRIQIYTKEVELGPGKYNLEHFQVQNLQSYLTVLGYTTEMNCGGLIISPNMRLLQDLKNWLSMEALLSE